MMGTKKAGVLFSPHKRTVTFYIRKIRDCKEHKLTGCLKGIKILDRRRSEGRVK
jgi:hypothetical protein